MSTKDALAKFVSLKADALALIKRDPKRSAIVAGSAVAAIAILSSGGNAVGGGLFGGGWQSHEVYDANGPGGRMVAATIETPSGWSVQGGVNWHNPNDATDPYKFSITAVSADGERRVEFLPAQSWANGGAGGFSRVGKETTAEGVVKNLFVPKCRPGAKVVEVERNAKVVSTLKSQTQALQAAAVSGGSRMDLDVVLVGLEYEENGKRYEEGVISMLQSTTNQPSRSQQAMMGQMGMQMPTMRFNHSQIITMRAPAGEMESAVAELSKVLESLKMSEPWNAVVAQYHSKKSRQMAADSSARLRSSQQAHNTRMRSNQQAFEASQAAYRSTGAANDAANRNWLNAHLGQADFHNPHSGQVESHSFDGGRMWQDNSGQTFSTESWQDDPRMNPNNWNRGIEEMRQINW